MVKAALWAARSRADDRGLDRRRSATFDCMTQMRQKQKVVGGLPVTEAPTSLKHPASRFPATIFQANF